jgi:DNA recombination-dependent growth factor C
MNPTSPVLPSDERAIAIEVTFAKDQDQYRQLPAVRTDDGNVISRWHLTWRERFKILFGGNLFLQQLTFNESLQPQLPSVDEPKLKWE